MARTEKFAKFRFDDAEPELFDTSLERALDPASRCPSSLTRPWKRADAEDRLKATERSSILTSSHGALTAIVASSVIVAVYAPASPASIDRAAQVCGNRPGSTLPSQVPTAGRS